MAEEKNENEIQIDLGSIFSFILRKIWILIICLVVGAGIGFGAAKLTKTDVYATRATYVVYYDGGETFNDVLAYQTRVSSVLGSCLTFVQQNRFANTVARKMNESGDYNITASDVYRSISYGYSIENGNTITIVSRSENAEKAYYMLMVVTDIFGDYIKENYGLAGDTSLMFSLANDIDIPVSPVADNSVLVYTLVGGLAAALICILVFAIIVITDQRVKGEDDITGKYGIAVLGSVPNFEDKDLVNGGEY